LRKAAFALVGAAILAALSCALAKPRGAVAARRIYPDSATVIRQIEQYRQATWHWQRVMGLRPTPASDTATSDPSLTYKLWVRELWRRRALAFFRRAENPPHKEQWLCIHRYEGSWSDAGSPYYGGLQMDITFQRHYGGYLLVHKGTADHWTPLEQMWVAERALESGRGFYPWPNTARYCGLLS
jgi:hypothetical protein